ncbi:helix-turn-helix transcriptional regulator [Neptuniibacter sp. SY11_33]|uniref:helix-turn-helix transcriptional regulator n=1 Tax=Neptuniibacter sp. SY11_33 TaxID=3398215 RepID=UPI0039F5C876
MPTQTLLQSAKHALEQERTLPFSVYSSVEEQHILNVPILKPLLIFVLSGVKKLGKDEEMLCPTGNFVFLSNSPTIDMRNIPGNEEYLAVLIEFEHGDFDHFRHQRNQAKKHFLGEIDGVLETTLQQYMEWSLMAPEEAWHFRKKELLQVMLSLGHNDVLGLIEPPSFSHQLQEIIGENISGDCGVSMLTERLAVSESTLRRKLKAEGTCLQDLKDRTKLGYGLHLVQTTMDPIGLIAERCGYQSQSRFTDKFKQLFDITPTELRKTRLQS